MSEIPFLEERLKVCAAARSYLGIRWRGQGRDHNGVDCVGLVVMAFRDAGWTVDEGTPDYRGVDSKRLVRILQHHCNLLPKGAELFPADLVIYGLPAEGHLALLLDGRPLNAIHSPIGKKVAEARFDPKRGNIRGYYRWRQFSLPSR